MPAQAFIGAADGAGVYKVGRVGLDLGSADPGGAFTGTFKTERFSPAGEDGLCEFRRVALRIWRTSKFTLTLTVWVDDLPTQVYSLTGVASDQSLVVSRGTPAVSPEEIVVEMEIRARGTFIQVQGDVVSSSVSGVFLPESLEVQYLPLRAARGAI
jgi:hypothetical protein